MFSLLGLGFGGSGLFPCSPHCFHCVVWLSTVQSTWQYALDITVFCIVTFPHLYTREFSNLPLSPSFSPNSFYSSSNPLSNHCSIFFLIPPLPDTHVVLLFSNHQSSCFLVRKENICSTFSPGHCNKSSSKEHCVFSSSGSEQFFSSAETWIHGILPVFLFSYATV